MIKKGCEKCLTFNNQYQDKKNIKMSFIEGNRKPSNKIRVRSEKW